MKKNLMIVTGEASGDAHGASLINEINKIDPEVNVFGIGGERMMNAGMIAQYHIKDLAFLGFAEVIKHIPFIKRVQKSLINLILEKDIKTVVLIDYPGFNLNFAKKLKRLNREVIYYISPQIWAWGKNRINKIKKLVDKMLVVFPFEKEFYKKENLHVDYVGHPLIEQIEIHKFLPKEDLWEKYDLNKSKEILLLMPGSRKQEIQKIFPETIKAAVKLADEFNMQVVVACSQNIDKELFRELSGENNFKLISNHNYDLMKYSKFGIIKSGTSTLEAGLFALPSIVVYATSWITYWIGRLLIKVKNIAMANIILGETVFEELIQTDVNSNKIYEKSKEILSDDKLFNMMKDKLESLKEKLGGSGASNKAAKIIYKSLTNG